jgi:hypothetical protein
MGDVSLNGWPVLDDGDPRIATGTIPGVGRPVTCARAALPVFLHFYAAWQKEMGTRMSIKTGPIDGHEVRQARAASGYSNHASGTAVDVLYDTVLPADGEPHMTAAEKTKLDKILSRYVTTDGHRILANGEWWRSPHCDGMHTELSQGWDRGALRNTTAADVANVIKRLGIKPDGTVSPLQKVINVIKPKPKVPLSAHQAHLAHLANTGQKPPAPLPPKPVPPKPAPLTAHQLHMQHLAHATSTTPAVATGSGPDWLIKFLRAHKVPNERAWFAIGMRESGGDPSCIYPAGSPKNGWATDQAPYWDTGLFQVNNRHYSDVARLYGSDMRSMLNAENNLDFALKHLAWSDWGLEITSDAAGNATGFKFNWAGWPSPYQPGQSGAVSAEAGFKEWWDAYPTYAAKVK